MPSNDAEFAWAVDFECDAPLLVQFFEIIVQAIYVIIVINAMTNPCIFTVPSCIVLLRFVNVIIIVIIIVCTCAVVVVVVIVVGRPLAFLHISSIFQLHAMMVVLLVALASSSADPDLVDFVKRRERRGRDAIVILEDAERR
jgi:hypothetical protein